MSIRYLIGIDEAGRGPIAGPVAVGAVWWPLDIGCPSDFAGRPVKDSKQLSERQRTVIGEKLEALRRERRLDFAVALVGHQTIDRIGIVAAIGRGVRRCLGRLVAGGINPAECQVLLDGGLRAPADFLNQQTIIRGDESEPTISLASILAKVRRDLWMIRQAEYFPVYGFERHKGYGTTAHYQAITKYGLCLIHRRSFTLSSAMIK